MWKETRLAKFVVVLWDLCGLTEEDHKYLGQDSRCLV